MYNVLNNYATKNKQFNINLKLSALKQTEYNAHIFLVRF